MCLFMLPPSVVLFILTMLWVTVRAERARGHAVPSYVCMTQIPAHYQHTVDFADATMLSIGYATVGVFLVLFAVLLGLALYRYFTGVRRVERAIANANYNSKCHFSYDKYVLPVDTARCVVRSRLLTKEYVRLRTAAATAPWSHSPSRPRCLHLRSNRMFDRSVGHMPLRALLAWTTAKY